MKFPGWSWLSVLCFSTLIHIVIFWPVLKNPNAVIIASSSDAVKSYYAFHYHLKYDEEYWVFNGLHYPFGEHLIYADGQAGLSIPLKWLSKFFPFIESYGVGVLNVFLIISYIISPFFIYGILRHFKIRRWYAIIAAISIHLLSPQVLRIGAHPSLAYAFIIPAGIFLILKTWNQTRFSTKYLMFFLFLLSFSTSIHPYFGLCLLALSFLYGLTFSFLNSLRKSFGKLLVFIGSSVGVFGLTVFILRFYDTHQRISDAYGFYHYHSRLKDIIMPHSGPLKEFYDSLWGRPIGLTWEGWSYVGLLVLLVIPVWVIYVLLKKHKFLPEKSAWSLFIASSLLLLFACNVPSLISPKIWDVFPPIKQFRSLGRFSWPFFFVINIMAIYALDKWARKVGWLNMVFIPLIVLPFCWDGFRHFNEVTNHQSIKKIAWNSPSPISKSVQSNTQAILPLPWFHVGSETFTVHPPDALLQRVFDLSAQTGLPICANHASRTSTQETKTMFRWMSPVESKMVQPVDPKNQLLLLAQNSQLNHFDQSLLSAAHQVYNQNGITYATLSASRINATKTEVDFAKDTFNKTKLSLSRQKMKPYNLPLVYAGKKWQKNHIGTFDNLFTEDTLTVHLELFNGFKNALNFGFKIHLAELSNRDTLQIETIIPEKSRLFDGNWTLVKSDFIKKQKSSKIVIYTSCHGKNYGENVPFLVRRCQVFYKPNQNDL